MTVTSWKNKQLSMVMQSRIPISIGEAATYSAVYWILKDTAFSYSYLWWVLGLIHASLVFIVPSLIIYVSQHSTHIKEEHAISSTMIFMVCSVLLWAYVTISGYHHLGIESQALYTVIIAGISSATVASILHSTRLAVFTTSGYLLPYIYTSFLSESKIGEVLALLAFIFLGALIHQIFILHSAIKKEFLLAEQNKALLEENKKNTENLIQTSKMVSIGEMAGGIAHEINTPLAIIAGSVNIMKSLNDKGELENDYMLKSLTTIEKTVHRIARIVSGLKIVSRDSQTTNLEEVPTHEIYADILGLCSEKFKTKGIVLKSNLTLDKCPESIFCDRVQLSQTILNLMNNAHDAIIDHENKWIQINFSQNEKSYIIQVIDSGDGLSEDVQEKAFDPFYTSKPVGQGTGLGLSLSKSIIENQNGSLIYNKNSEHSCFEIRLPKRSDVIQIHSS